MKRMDCQRASGMLPLYVAGDLEGARPREVAAHLAACDDCRRLAAEFNESRNLLAEACATPEFGADFYAGIRSAVLDEISRDRPTPSTPSSFIASPFITSLFGRRLAYAASFAVALIILALAFQHARRAAPPAPEEIVHEQLPAPESMPERRTMTPAPSPDVAVKESSPSATIAATLRRHPTRRDTATRQDEANPLHAAQTVNDAQTAATLVAAIPRAAVNPARDVSATATVAPASAAGQPASEVSRIEIQTSDPNIRIIWLAPQKSEEPRPNTDKRENPYNHENGERK
jgi:anti-sigma factor RsiW